MKNTRPVACGRRDRGVRGHEAPDRYYPLFPHCPSHPVVGRDPDESDLRGGRVRECRSETVSSGNPRRGASGNAGAFGAKTGARARKSGKGGTRVASGADSERREPFAPDAARRATQPAKERTRRARGCKIT